MRTVKVRLFNKKEVDRRRRLYEAEAIDNIAAEIARINTQMEQIKRDCQRRLEPLEKKLIELNKQQSSILGKLGTQVSQSNVQNQTTPTNGINAAPGAPASNQTTM